MSIYWLHLMHLGRIQVTFTLDFTLMAFPEGSGGVLQVQIT